MSCSLTPNKANSIGIKNIAVGHHAIKGCFFEISMMLSYFVISYRMKQTTNQRVEFSKLAETSTKVVGIDSGQRL